MKKILALCAFALSTACAHTTHDATTAADGRPAYQTSCRGDANDACLTEASQTCGGHYAVLDKENVNHATAKTGVRAADAAAPDTQYVTYRCDTVAH